MKQAITFLSFLLCGINSNAQNIVPNFSFEEADSCPKNINKNPYEYSLGCVGWGQATSGTADYFNACDTAASSIGEFVPIVGVPSNSIGYQDAYNGVAYTGITMYGGISDPEYKEYLITNIPALTIDTAYQVTIHAALASYCDFETDGLGVLFTTYGSPDQLSVGTLTETPQIDYSSYGIISDTAKWTTLTRIFLADSAYTSLIIGGFKSSNNMNIVNFNSNGQPYSYYFIDAVVVEKLSSTGIATINSGDAKIYPNPFTGHATLIFNNPYHSNYTLTVSNMQGQVVQHIYNITTGRVRIERNNLPSGFYYYQLRGGDGSVANGKLVIQ